MTFVTSTLTALSLFFTGAVDGDNKIFIGVDSGFIQSIPSDNSTLVYEEIRLGYQYEDNSLIGISYNSVPNHLWEQWFGDTSTCLFGKEDCYFDRWFGKWFGSIEPSHVVGVFYRHSFSSYFSANLGSKKLKLFPHIEVAAKKYLSGPEMVFNAYVGAKINLLKQLSLHVDIGGGYFHKGDDDGEFEIVGKAGLGFLL